MTTLGGRGGLGVRGGGFGLDSSRSLAAAVFAAISLAAAAATAGPIVSVALKTWPSPRLDPALDSSSYRLLSRSRGVPM